MSKISRRLALAALLTCALTSPVAASPNVESSAPRWWSGMWHEVVLWWLAPVIGQPASAPQAAGTLISDPNGLLSAASDFSAEPDGTSQGSVGTVTAPND